ncbi:MAG: HAD family hydrolase [Candidatus Acidiferrales bacterium]
MPRRRPLITTVVFDLDDTLYDCLRQRVLAAHRYASRQLLRAGLQRRLGRRISFERLWRLRLRLFREERNLATLDARLLARLGVAGPLAARLARLGPAAYFSLPVGKLRLFPDTLPTLRRLHRSGVRLYILTAGHKRIQQAKIRALGLNRLPYLRAVFYTGLLAGRGKLHYLRQVLRYEPNPRRILVVGDRPDSEIRAARRLGMWTVRRLGGEFARYRPSHRLERPDFTIRKLSSLFRLPFHFGSITFTL